jgi:hypothetical protein
MLTGPKEIVESFDVRLLANLSDNFRSPYEAILELVDNALAARRDGRTVLVTMVGPGALGGNLRVVAKGGAGMGWEELAEFLRWGKAPEEAGLNRYGQGGKAALGYLGRGLRIRCNRYDETTAYEIEDDEWLVRPSGELKRFVPREVAPAVPSEGVVQIDVLGLRRTINMKRLVRELAWRYRPALLTEALRLTIAGRRIEPAPLPADVRTEIRRVVAVHGSDYELCGWVGIAPSRFDGRGGLRCSAFGRVVLEHEYFGHRTSSFKASLNSLVGEVDLSFVPVVLNKNAFDKASPEWETAQQILYEELDPLVKHLLRRREQGEPTEEERLRAMEARDVAQRALEALAAEAASAGRGGQNRGRKPPRLRDMGGDTEQDRSSAGPSREAPQPRTPPPANAVGKLLRRGNRLEWDVRSLDPRIRSARTIESGRSEIIINNRYPLYRQRRGDLLYMVETGLLEELRLEEDGAERRVDEYHEQIVAAMFAVVTELSEGRNAEIAA